MMQHRDRHQRLLAGLFGALTLLGIPGQAVESLTGAIPTRIWHFEEVPVGEVPSGWQVAATHPKGRLPVWQVVEDPTAPSPTHALAMSRPGGKRWGFFGETFNLCWTDQFRFRDGSIEVRFKALEGDEDQGGGVMWRVQDKDNYYIARFNPLEDNFRLYSVRNGQRKTLASAPIALPAGKWHRLKIAQYGDRFSGYLNGKKLLDGTDMRLRRAGGVGLWTKADAVTAFDDFTVGSE